MQMGSQTSREYTITWDDSDIHLALFVDGVQVAGALFPGDDYPDAASLAEEIGQAFTNNYFIPTIH